MSVEQITPELLASAFVGMDGNRPVARGKILRLLDGDIDKCNALAIEHGLDHFSDYMHKGKAVAAPKALTTPTKIQENDENAPKGSNPWVSDCVDAQGRPDWSPAARRAQSDKTRQMGAEFAARLAESAGSFLGQSRPNAKRLTPLTGGDTRTNSRVMGGT